MLREIALAGTAALLFVCGSRGIAAESLESTLRAANLPIQKFAVPDLREQITSYAISTGDPFLLAYYTDDGSSLLRPPLHIIRYSRDTDTMQRAEIRDIDALFQVSIRMGCLGSALKISERHGTIYIETHVNPSAGCVIVLSSGLSFRAALSGWPAWIMEPDYAILQGSERHFMAVHPLHIQVFDVRRNRSLEVFPPKGDVFRQEYSRLIQARISQEWCMENNAQCDPENFDTELKGELAVNHAARAFGFEAIFDAAGFGHEAAEYVPPRTVAYIFRERDGKWQYREFEPSQVRSQFSMSTIGELVARNPGAAFEVAGRK